MNINQRCLQTGRKYLWPFHAAQDFFFPQPFLIFVFFPITAKHSETFFSLLSASLSGDTHMERCSARFTESAIRVFFFFFFLVSAAEVEVLSKRARKTATTATKRSGGCVTDPETHLWGQDRVRSKANSIAGDWRPSLQSSSNLLHLTLF